MRDQPASWGLVAQQRAFGEWADTSDARNFWRAIAIEQLGCADPSSYATMNEIHLRESFVAKQLGTKCACFLCSKPSDEAEMVIQMHAFWETLLGSLR